MINKCPICGSSDVIASTYQVFDDRYAYPGFFTLYICSSCKHKFLNHKFSSNELGNLYSNYYPRSTMKIEDYKPLQYTQGFASWFNGEHKSAFTYIPPNVKVLDIGCGFGQSLGYHKSRGCDVYGVEADENIQRVADKFGFRVKVGLFDANDYEKDFFDYVTMDQVIEHMSDPIQVLSDVFSVLKPGAHAIVSTPNATGWGAKLFGKRWINWHTPYHLQHFSKKSLTLTATKAGFTIVSLRTVTSSEWLYYQWIHLVTFPKPGEKSVFWNPCSTKLSLKQKIILKILHTLHKIKCNHFLTRFFDAIGIGDNYILVLKKPQ